MIAEEVHARRNEVLESAERDSAAGRNAAVLSEAIQRQTAELQELQVYTIPLIEKLFQTWLHSLSIAAPSGYPEA